MKKVIFLATMLIFIGAGVSPVIGNSIGQIDVKIQENTVNLPFCIIDQCGGTTKVSQLFPTGVYYVIGHDLEGKKVKYFIDYGDGTIDESDFVNNYQIYITKHTFPKEKASYTLKFWCIDVDYNESPDEYLPVHVPRYMPTMFQYPIFQMILHRIGSLI